MKIRQKQPKQSHENTPYTTRQKRPKINHKTHKTMNSTEYYSDSYKSLHSTAPKITQRQRQYHS